MWQYLLEFSDLTLVIKVFFVCFFSKYKPGKSDFFGRRYPLLLIYEFMEYNLVYLFWFGAVENFNLQESFYI